MVRRGKKNETIAGVEIGTKSIKIVIAEILPDQSLKVIGHGETPSLKVQKGEITDVNSVFKQLDKTAKKAEKDAETRIKNVYIAVTGGHIKTLNNRGSLPIVNSNKRITEDDVVNVTRNARTVSLPHDCEMIDSLHRHYIIDNARSVQNPINIAGSKLEAEVHIIYGSRNNLHTTLNVVEDYFSAPCEDIIFSGICAAYGALTDEDNEKGALVIDIGAGTTEYVLNHDRACLHSGVITVGSNQILNDLTLGLKLPSGKCRAILENYGAALSKADGRSRL